MSADCEGDQQFSDQEIVSLMTQDFDEESDTINKVDDTERYISHSEGAKALEVAFHYVEQHWNATATDVMFMRR